MLCEYWHTTYLEEGVGEGGGGQPGSDGTVTQDSVDAMGVLAYNIPVGRGVRELQQPARRWRGCNAGQWRCSWSIGIQHTWRKVCMRVGVASPAVTAM
jgi:hypothetical protein